MKNLVKTILCLGLFIGLIVPNLPTSANTEHNTTPYLFSSTPILTNEESGEIIESAIKDIKQTSRQARSDGSITESFEVEVVIPIDSKLRDVAGGTITEASCKTTLDITYYLRNNNQEIKITNISGGWYPTFSDVVVSEREAAVTDGGFPPFNKVLRQYPSKNTFSYDTGWGYMQYYPGSEYTGARGYTQATLTIPGMGGKYNLFMPVNISR